MASVFLCFLTLFSSLLILASSSSSSPTITLSLTPSTSNSWQYISHITKSTIDRAHHLKNPHRKPPFGGLHKTEETPLFARSYGGYSVHLSFGTPPQKIPLVFDTGSSLLWVPCTSRYTCSNCTFSGVDPTKITTFIPRLSTTRIVGCKSPKCGWLYGPDVRGRCSDCGPDLSNCTAPCPTYFLGYGLGSTIGLAITENLDLPGEVVPDFFLGCSLVSSRQPEGIAGFGRAPTSLPNQLKLRKFSYCLLSHNFDDKPKSSALVLTGGATVAKDGRTRVKYSQFQKNPSKSPYDEYYYVSLSKITVGRRRVKFPRGLLRPGPDGHGGTIVDSGSTFTFMERALFEPLVAELVAQTGHLRRAREVEAGAGFGLCYDVSGQRNVSTSVKFPKLVFHFVGGANMVLPLANYFSFINDSGALCLTIVTDSSPAGPSVALGPAIILGNYQQQNFYIEYDLKDQRFGFKKQKCG